MKKVLLAMSILAFAILSSCATGYSSTSATKSSKEYMTPDKLADLVLSGTGKSGDVKYVFKTGGTLEYTLNGKIYTGTWSFDNKKEMLKYTITWNQDGKEKGYIADVVREGDKYTILGYWYITDAYITLFDELKIAE